MNEINKDKLTPMMRQYMEIKEQYQECILFYRLGDFYEMFFSDAITASKELEITLTGRECGQEERAPMCGIPHHASENYIGRLVEKGYKVAICEQTEDAKNVKGIVKREVIRIVTPGTSLSAQLLDETKNNYIVAVVKCNGVFGVTAGDITTGELLTTQINEGKKVFDELSRWMPKEILVNQEFGESVTLLESLKDRFKALITVRADYFFEFDRCRDVIQKQFKVSTLEGLGLGDYKVATQSTGCLIEYLNDTQKSQLKHLNRLKVYATNAFMILDSSSRRNLELTETLREKERKGTLLWVLDRTKTALGARNLRRWIEQPLVDQKQIETRLDSIQELIEQSMVREELKEYLNSIYDLERLMSRISCNTANSRDLIALKHSFAVLPGIYAMLQELKQGYFFEQSKQFDVLSDIFHLIDQSILEEPPFSLREGNMIKEGFHKDVDHYREAKNKGTDWIAAIEARERDATGIKNLKVKFNKVFGYYIEVTNSYQHLVPITYTRKQTTANSERYITPELKELEDTILNAEEKLVHLEYQIFQEIKEKISSEIIRIQETAEAIGIIDTFVALAEVSMRNRYCRPEINAQGIIHIKEGRHPVVEQMIGLERFVANDLMLDLEQQRFSIITGPNMSGKSTFMRQGALIVLMAQMGCFVPATAAKISITDRIFTRVGASDDLASGQSTFMVEMTEVANILRNASSNSLIILDEIGRGTSTFDGLSIAWAVVEHVSNKNAIGAKTLFATHYHELTELEGKMEGVNNYCIQVKESGDDVIFLRKIVRGEANGSYGIEVAKLAGIPDQVILRAKQLLEELEDADIVKKSKVKKGKIQSQPVQMTLFNENPYESIIDAIKSLSVLEMSPMEAMNQLYALKKSVDALTK